MDITLTREKIEQATGLLDDLGIDAWLVFTRETSETPDPALRLILGRDVTWQSAFLLTRRGQRIAIVGGPEGAALRATGLYERVLTYDASIAPVLRAVLAELDPAQIAIDYALGDVASDGLTHGMYLQLVAALRRTPYRARLISAAPVVGALRSRKTGIELDRMRRALALTEELFALVTPFLRPGRTEREVAEMLHAEVRARGLETSWEAEFCPTVNAGASSEPGHTSPSDIAMQPGDLVHLDFGVAYEGYRADLQRMWYLRGPEELEPPASVVRAFETCVAAIEAGRSALRAGVAGWQVDALARETLIKAGYPEYMHALGHSVGRATHDGGPLLGPRWPRYGEAPDQPIQPQSVYTLELGTPTERGYVGLEDEVLVTSEGATYLSPPQRALILAG